ncbi:SMC-Scp complex subunit ScpB [Paracidobacterium acidisoli]|uniref:SMC-Scp complex subunit ScpB n=1 Tax=Paracidobacterium acidisoli TaxID=2303751 RepID=UPI0018F216F3|nr:SMC-Scp complex subunit ScpB [Paracidobacterium acidisoli]MBT9331278.1 SMC-Scp complex subunit ScpB [Paracidobacterium acidisoli]
MSLKARIEAVIYAAEEPVTLAQLAALFHQEALEHWREREVAAGIPESLREAAGGEIAADPALSLEAMEAAGTVESAAEESATAESEPAQAEETAQKAEQPPEEAESPVTEPTAEDEKKAARQRDREIRDELRRILDELMTEYDGGSRGMEIREVAGGYRVATRPEYHDSVRAFVKSLKPPMKLSLQALETLAVIAYKQPVTAPEIGEIRGVDSAGVLGSLISRKLVTTAGRKQVIGRPILYKTTKEFLLRFGLKDLNELPSMEEFEKMASELSDGEPIGTRPTELPFAQNEAAEVEEALAAEGEGSEAETAAENGHEGVPVAVGVSHESAEEHPADIPGVDAHHEEDISEEESNEEEPVNKEE